MGNEVREMGRDTPCRVLGDQDPTCLMGGKKEGESRGLAALNPRFKCFIHSAAWSICREQAGGSRETCSEVFTLVQVRRG